MTRSTCTASWKVRHRVHRAADGELEHRGDGACAGKVGIPIVADQSAFTLFDVHEICRHRAADMICIGPREIGGIQPMMKAAAVAEAAGLKICIHSSFTTGVTTSAEHQIALAIPNLDDGNQIMWQLVREDIVASSSLTPKEGWLQAFQGPGLGFTLDEGMVAEGEERFRSASRA